MAETRILKLAAGGPDPNAIREAAEAIRAGKTVVFPTETVYGIGCRATDARAVRRIFEIKGRAAEKPLACYVASSAEVARYGVEFPEDARRLAERFWPGPLTLLLPAPGGGRTGFRCPDDPHALALLLAAGVPVAGTSANRSGEAAPVTGAEAAAAMEGLADLVLEGGRTRCGGESTIVDAGGKAPRIVREGAVGRAAIEGALGRGIAPVRGGG